jgi:hypothetical protein
MCFSLKKNKKIRIVFGYFFEFVGISGILVSVSAIDHTSVAIERTAAFHYSICVPAVNRLHVRVGLIRPRPTLERSVLIRSIAPLLQLSVLGDYYILARLRSITRYLRSSASPQLATTNQRQLSTIFLLIFLV